MAVLELELVGVERAAVAAMLEVLLLAAVGVQVQAAQAVVLEWFVERVPLEVGEAAVQLAVELQHDAPNQAR